MESVVYDCPNCNEHYVLWDSSMPPISAQKNNDLWEAVRKQYDEVGSCKKCVRTDPNIPTTFEMDGLLTREDILNRNKVMLLCQTEAEWKEVDISDREQCPDCNSKLLGSSIISSSTFSPTWQKKFKVKKR